MFVCARKCIFGVLKSEALNKADACCVHFCSIAFAFGDTILPEVQATVGGDSKKVMYKGVSCGYAILLSSYMVVAIAGALLK